MEKKYELIRPEKKYACRNRLELLLHLSGGTNGKLCKQTSKTGSILNCTVKVMIKKTIYNTDAFF